MTNLYNQQLWGYENIEFNLSTGQTDYDLAANQTTFLSYYGPANGAGASGGIYPSRVQIRTNQTISVKLNSTSNHAITIASTDSPLVIDGTQISNIYLTNSSGSTAAVKLLFTDNPN